MPYQETAQPQGYETGTDRQGGGATPLGVAGGLVAGMGSPIVGQGLSPEVEAEIRARYMRLYNDITVEEVRLQGETVETWGTLSASLISAHANMLSAVAEGAKATAMSDQAVAEALGGLDGMLDMATELTYFEPDKETWDAWTVQAQAMDAKVLSSMGSEGYGSGVSPDSNSRDAFMRYTDVLNGTQVRALDQVTLMVEHGNNLSGEPTKRTTTLMKEYGMFEAQARKSFATMAAQDGYPATDEEIEGWTQAYMQTHVQPVVFGSDGQGGLLTQEERTIHEQKKMQALEDIGRYYGYMDDMGAGLDPQLVNEARMALANAERVVAGGPLAFSDIVMSMPTPEGTTHTKAMIERELARLDQVPVDPLNAARAEILAVPGFDVWMQAMGFSSVDRAMMYAGNHPYEFRDGVKAYVMAQQGTAPASAATAAGMREYLKQRGDEEGIGFHVTPLERAIAPFTGRRNLGFDLSDRLTGIRQRLEGYQPRTEPGMNIRDRLLQGLGVLPKERKPTDYAEGRDPEGLYGESPVDVIEADVRLHTDLAKVQQEQVAEEVDPGFRDVDGAGGYRYRQYADGRLEIIQNPKGAVNIEVPQGSTAYKAISAELGDYVAPSPAPAAQGAAAPAAAAQGALPVSTANPEEEAFIAAAQEALKVPHARGLENRAYDLVTLADEDGGWTVRVYDDFTVQVVDAPGFDEQVGQVFKRGTYAQQELMSQTPRAKSTVPVKARDLGEDITFGEPTEEDVRVEMGDKQAAAPAKKKPAATAKAAPEKKKGPVLGPGPAIAGGYPGLKPTATG